MSKLRCKWKETEIYTGVREATMQQGNDVPDSLEDMCALKKRLQQILKAYHGRNDKTQYRSQGEIWYELRKVQRKIRNLKYRSVE